MLENADILHFIIYTGLLNLWNILQITPHNNHKVVRFCVHETWYIFHLHTWFFVLIQTKIFAKTDVLRLMNFGSSLIQHIMDAFECASFNISLIIYFVWNIYCGRWHKIRHLYYLHKYKAILISRFHLKRNKILIKYWSYMIII